MVNKWVVSKVFGEGGWLIGGLTSSSYNRDEFVFCRLAD